MVLDRIAKLRQVKKQLGLSYEALGHELGVHSQSVFRWLQKGVVPRSHAYVRAIDRFLTKDHRSQKRNRKKSRG